MELERIGGQLCLDFANTVGPRYSRPDKSSADFLGSMRDFLRWCADADLIAPHSVAALERDTGPITFAYCLDVREAIYRTFAAVAASRDPHPDDVATILASHTALLRDAVLRVEPRRAELTWPGITVAAALGPIVLSAVDLLRQGSFERIRQCPGHDGSCGWLFYDTSKNNSRRWCSMAQCGTHNKSHRQSARIRAARN
ncbi:putative RNA-binding Zn ribbon-like protein [Nocardia tenerifensis]|uniref:Putative RNA-binding Zn ribbon-like protein n=1 Tax=Nocardia tenerifensis TaxID=228006 RepID=A0A318JSS0_9NOCA|nr:ABATE domain-containing protein [Nocardia tenerifensis]PXX58159.1 putative RNA-binding Zn ribbon-like protein [Nocardia tenerifensis]